MPLSRGPGRSPNEGRSMGRWAADTFGRIFSRRNQTDQANQKIEGIPNDGVYSPGQPVTPLAQVDTEGRQWDFEFGVNQRWADHDGSQTGISFTELRFLADESWTVRSAIERRKDDMARLKWELISDLGTEDKPDPNIDILTKQLRFPDQEHTYAQWQRMALEDVYVIDALAVEPIKTVDQSAVVKLGLVDASTIKRLINYQGRTPAPPSPAYQQIIKGTPVRNVTTDDLMYYTRNPRTFKLYGFSQVEQIILIVNMALRRDIHMLQYFTDGTMPDSIIEGPEGWKLPQIKQFQRYWDALLSGNTGERRKTRWVPQGIKPHWLKSDLQKTEFDEWLVRVVMFVFGLSPASFVPTMNKATAEERGDDAKEAGLEPTMTYWADFMNILIQKYMGYDHITFRFVDEKQVDEQAEAERDALNIRNGVLSIDDIAKKHGKIEIGIPRFIEVQGGIIMVDDLVKYAETGEIPPALKPMAAPPPAFDPGGSTGPAPPFGKGRKPKPGEKKKAGEKEEPEDE